MNTTIAYNGSVGLLPGLTTGDHRADYWIRQVTLRLRREIAWLWHERGLLPDPDPSVLPPFTERGAALLDLQRFSGDKARHRTNDPTARYLSEQIDMPMPGIEHEPLRGSFGWVVSEVGLDDTSAFILALALTPVLDHASASVMATCLNDPLRPYPTLALAQRLWDRPEEVLWLADGGHPLCRRGLISIPQARGIDWDGPITVAPLVAGQLLYPGGSLPETLVPLPVPKAIRVSPEEARLLASRLLSRPPDRLTIVPVSGMRGTPVGEAVAQIAQVTGRQAVEFNGTLMPVEDARPLSAILTYCWLRGLDLFIESEMLLPAAGERSRLGSLFQAEALPVTIFLGTRDRATLTSVPGRFLLPVVTVPTLTYADRVEYWKSSLGEQAERLDQVIAESARRFRFETETIDRISASLRILEGPIGQADFVALCRSEVDLDLGELAQRVIPRFTNEELILPPREDLQFREVLRATEALTEVHYEWGTARVWNEGGITTLFAGPPGTGKTMAAEILAAKLNLPLYRIDLSQVVNKYIGETEKNLKRVFDAADQSDVILFFDEADAIFGRRTEVKDAHDRYANLEISYLLERMERFRGSLTILATNRKRDLDDAFLRRIRYLIDFPLPGVAERELIWRQVIPKAIDASEVDVSFLARHFPLSGGHIRSIVFNACLQSADGTAFTRDIPKGRLSMRQVIIALKREYDKINRTVGKEQFGAYAHIVEDVDHE